MGYLDDLKKTGRNVGLGALAAVGFGTFLKETAKQEHPHEPQYQQQQPQHQYRDYAAEDRAAVRSLHAIDYNRCPKKDRGYSRGRGR